MGKQEVQYQNDLIISFIPEYAVQYFAVLL